MSSELVTHTSGPGITTPAADLGGTLARLAETPDPKGDNRAKELTRHVQAVYGSRQCVAKEALVLLFIRVDSDETVKAYDSDLRDFFRWWKGDTITSDARGDALEELLTLPQASVVDLMGLYVSALKSKTFPAPKNSNSKQPRRLSPRTIARRLSTIRSLFDVAVDKMMNCAPPSTLKLKKLTTGKGEDNGTITPQAPPRDLKGPTLEELKALVDAPDTSTLRGKRDRAILLLMATNALRRSECIKCDVSDFDPARKLLYITGKGHGGHKTSVDLGTVTVTALLDYLHARGETAPDEPLFLNHYKGGGRKPASGTVRTDGRLSAAGLYVVIHQYTKKVIGRHVRPHGLRHGALTVCKNAFDITIAQAVARHKDSKTTQAYLDDRDADQKTGTDRLCELVAPTVKPTTRRAAPKAAGGQTMAGTAAVARYGL